MPIFADEPSGTTVDVGAGLALSEDLSLVSVMSTLSQRVAEVPEGRRLLRVALIRLGEQAVVAELTAKAMQISPQLAAQAIQAEARFINTVFDILDRFGFSPKVRQELCRRADLIFEELDVDLRTILRLANKKLAEIIIRSLGTERPLSFLDRFLY